MKTTVELQEYAAIATGRVDRETGIIRGVRIIGQKSRNGRTYTEAALAGAIPMYEGCSVYANHDRKDRGDRDVADKIGYIENVRMSQGAVYGDLHCLKSHPLTERLFEAAERNPKLFGLSHNSDGEIQRLNGRDVVVSIERVRSVDLVSNPATNNGLFESEEEVQEELDYETLRRLAGLAPLSESSGRLAAMLNGPEIHEFVETTSPIRNRPAERDVSEGELEYPKTHSEFLWLIGARPRP